MLHSGMLGYDGGRSPSPRAPAAERRDRPLGARLRRLARSLLPAATSLPRGFASPAPRGPARRFRAARSARPRPRGRRRLAASEARYSSPASWRAFRARSPASSAGRARSDLRGRPRPPRGPRSRLSFLRPACRGKKPPARAAPGLREDTSPWPRGPPQSWASLASRRPAPAPGRVASPPACPGGRRTGPHPGVAGGDCDGGSACRSLQVRGRLRRNEDPKK